MASISPQQRSRECVGGCTQMDLMTGSGCRRRISQILALPEMIESGSGGSGDEAERSCGLVNTILYKKIYMGHC